MHRCSTRACVVMGLEALAVGCGETADSDMMRLGHRLAGVYAVDAFTRNEQGCEREGPSVLEEQGDHYFLVMTDQSRSAEVVRVVSCESVAACRLNREALAAGGTADFEYSFVFSHLSSSNTLDGEAVSSGASDAQGACKEGELIRTELLNLGHGKVELRQRITRLLPHSEDDSGVCRPAREPLRTGDEGCAVLEVIAAERAAAL